MFDGVFVAQNGIETIPDALDEFKVEMSKYVSQINLELPSITNNLLEVLFVLIGDDLNHWSKNAAVQSVNYRLVGQSSAASRQKSAILIVESLTSVGDLTDVDWIQLEAKVVDTVKLKVDKVVSFDGFKPCLIQEIRPAQVFALQFFSDLVVRKEGVGSFSTVIVHDARSKLISSLEVIIIDALVPATSLPQAKLEA